MRVGGGREESRTTPCTQLAGLSGQWEQNQKAGAADGQQKRTGFGEKKMSHFKVSESEAPVGQPGGDARLVGHR